MKKFSIIALALALALGQYIAAQEDGGEPYLSEEDIAALEIILPEDVPEAPREAAAGGPDETKTTEVPTETLPPPGVSLPLYHLLILDRTYCALDSDIGGLDSGSVIYKLKHGRNGYLIAVYKAADNKVFPTLPTKSFIILDLMTNRPNTIREYVNSSVFKKFVSKRTILQQIQAALKAKF